MDEAPSLLMLMYSDVVGLYGVGLPCTPNQLEGYDDDDDEDKENQDPSGKGGRKCFL